MPIPEQNKNPNIIRQIQLLSSVSLDSASYYSRQLIATLAGDYREINLETGNSPVLSHQQYEISVSEKVFRSMELDNLADRANALKHFGSIESFDDFLLIGRSAADIQVQETTFYRHSMLEIYRIDPSKLVD